MEPSEPIAVRVSTVARLLDMSPNTILLLCREKKIPGAFKLGRAWGIPLSSIDALAPGCAGLTKSALARYETLRAPISPRASDAIEQALANAERQRVEIAS